MIRYSTPWALNASKSCFRSSGRVIGYSLESVGCGSCIPHSSKPFAHRTAPPITVDLSLLFLMAGESADCFICVHEACPHFHYIPFPISRCAIDFLIGLQINDRFEDGVGLGENRVFQDGLVGDEGIQRADTANRRVERVEEFIADAGGDLRAIAPTEHVFMSDDHAAGRSEEPRARNKGIPP